ncbi:MAG: hypothetical protein HY556_06415 [Euryarchaeota archaeon]|nr:hypothetical protein [Euryarchaeota archaeon]
MAGSLILSAVHFAAAKPGEDGVLNFTDRPGDTTSFGGNDGTALPQSALTDNVDIVGFKIHNETDRAFDISLALNKLDAVVDTATHSVFISSSYSLYFDGPSGDHTYRVGLNYQPFQCCQSTTPEPDAFASLYEAKLQGNDTDDFDDGFDFKANLPARVELATSTLSVKVPKELLIGTSGQKSTPKRGESIANFRATSNQLMPIPANDAAPDTGKFDASFVFGVPTTNAMLVLTTGSGRSSSSSQFGPFGQVSFEDDGSQPQAVRIGEPTAIPITVVNKAPAKKIVAITVQSSQKDWNVRAVDSVVMPAQSSRNITLIVEPPKSTKHLDTASVVVTGTVVGDEDMVGRVKIALYAVKPLSPEENTLYFHSRPYEAQGGVLDPVIIATGLAGTEVYLNPLKSDGSPDEPVSSAFNAGICFGGPCGSSTRRYSDAPLPGPFLLDPEKEAEATLAYTTAVPGTMRVDFALYYGNLLIGQGTDSQAVGGGETKFVFKFKPSSTKKLPAAGSKYMSVLARVQLEGASATNGIIGGTSGEQFASFVPRSSAIKLPVLRGEVVIPQLTSALITLDYDKNVGLEKYANPGNSTLYYLTVVNEGERNDTVHIEAFPETAAWLGKVVPAADFNLGPGESANFALSVTPPSDAKDGEIGKIRVNATSGSDKAFKASLLTTTIVTTGVKVPEEVFFDRENITAQAIAAEEEANNTPGFETGAMLAGAIAIALLARRRRT